MLYLLRQLRRLELHKRSGHYFLYAFGEIVLIVVGILIAVQIGDWKESQHLDKQRVELIKNLKSDFHTNLKNLDATLREFEENIDRFDGFLTDIFDPEKSPSIEYMKAENTSVFTSFVFRPLLGTYYAAVSSGAINLISDSQLNELFLDFEKRSQQFQFYNNMALEEFFQGGWLEVRKMVGSLAGFQYAYSAPRNEFTYTAEEYRELFKQKDVYAVYENFFLMKQLRYRFLSDLKELTERILSELEGED